MPSENQLSLLTTNGLEHTVGVPANALQISGVWLPPLRLFGSRAALDGRCFCDDQAFGEKKVQNKRFSALFCRLTAMKIQISNCAQH